MLVLLALLPGCTTDNGITKTNASPVATILSPADGASLREGTTTLRGSGSDADDDVSSLTARWWVDGLVVCDGVPVAEDGSTTCDAPLTTATTIELDVYDPDGAVGTDTVTVDVTATDAPVVTLDAPTADGIYYADHLVPLQGTALDAETASDALLLAWTSSLDGDLDVSTPPTSDGQFLGAVSLSAGEHFLVVTATDEDGKTGQAGVTIQVHAPNSAPGCSIDAPTDGSVGALGTTVAFAGTASDPDVPATFLAAEWSSDRDGALGTVTPDATGAISFPYAGLSAGVHTISLTVTDDAGAVCVDRVTYSVDSAPIVVVAEPRSGDVYGSHEDVDLSATVADAEDAATSLYVTWDDDVDGRLYAGNADSAGLSAATVADLSPGPHVVTVTVTDPAGLSASASVDYAVNLGPDAPTVSLSPGSPDTTDDLVASLEAAAVDPEGDPLTYTWSWTVNGAPSGASTSATLPASATTRGETWTVHVAASDPWSTGPEATASVVIGDSAPSVSTVTISPSSPTESDTLSCGWSGYADADGDADASTRAWTVNGAAAGTGSSLAGVFSEGDTVTCTVTPFDGTLTGSPVSASVTIGAETVSACPTGNCAVRFNGSDSYISVPDDRSLDGGAGAFTVEAWVWYDDINRGCMTTVRKGISSSPTFDYWLHKNISPADSLYWGSWTGFTVVSFSAVRSGAWLHYAGVYDPAAGEARAYINGLLVGSSPTYASPTANTEELRIGRDWDGGCDTLGVIDEVRISHVARYSGSFTPDFTFVPDADTAALWHFDEYTGSTAYDDSGNGNDGTLHNVVWTTEHPS